MKKKSNTSRVKAAAFGVMMSAAITADAANETTAVTGEVGEDVRLSLESSPAAGYGWMIKGLPDGLIFVSGGYEQSKDCPKGAVGCDGEEVLHFIDKKRGESTLKLICGQSFNKSSWQRREVKVVIR